MTKKPKKNVAPLQPRDKKIIFGIIFLIGMIIACLAIFGYVQQAGHETSVAEVTDVSCTGRFNPTVRQNEDRCDVTVSFRTAKGQNIKTRLTDILEDEITSHNGKSSMLVNYSPSDPKQVYDQDNLISGAVVIGMLSGGVVVMAITGYFLVKLRKLAK